LAEVVGALLLAAASGPISAGKILIPLVFASDFRNKLTS
jgi:hypothetical protein